MTLPRKCVPNELIGVVGVVDERRYSTERVSYLAVQTVVVIVVLRPPEQKVRVGRGWRVMMKKRRTDGVSIWLQKNNL